MLHFRILDLEKERLQQFATFKTERETLNTEMSKKQKDLETERMRVEELNSTKATLEALIEDLRHHLESTHKKLTEEIDKNTRLLNQNDDIVLNLKKVNL